MFACLILFASSIYFPGNLPNDFKLHEQLNVTINALRSSIRPIPLDYFKNDVFCSDDSTDDLRKNIGEYLSGDRFRHSLISFKLGEDLACAKLCQKQYNVSQKNYLINLIDNKYRYVFILDEIPASFVYKRSEFYSKTGLNSFSNESRSPGVEVGYIYQNEHYLNTHIDFLVKYSKIKAKGEEFYRIVGFDIQSAKNSQNGCQFSSKNSIEQSDNFEFSYSVTFKETDIDWSNRWNEMLAIDYSPKYHYISVFSILLLVFSLTCLVILLFFRMIKKDFLPKGGFDEQDPLDESGWQLIHGDVFRSPHNADRLCEVVGSGMQLFFGGCMVLIVASAGFLAPLNTGSMITALAVVFIIAAPFAGFVSSKLFHSISRTNNWKRNIFRSGLFFTLPSLLLYLIANHIFKICDSSAELSFKSFLDLIFLVVIDMLLYFVGSIFGLRSSPIEFPISVNQIPRQLPQPRWFLKPIFSNFVGGIAVFSVCFIEVFFIYRSLWTNLSYYYLFGLLLFVFIAMLIVSADISICFVYLHLIYEDYKWWWPAFRVPASSGICLFLYSIYFMITIYKPPDTSSVIIFLVFSLIFSIGLSLLTGSVGFYTSFMFVRKIYALLKME